MRSPLTLDRLVASRLEAEMGALWGLHINHNLFRGPERVPMQSEAGAYVPQCAVFVLLTSGDAPVPLHNQSPTDELRLSLNIRVRSEVGVFEEGQDLAHAVWFAIHRAALPEVIECECLESVPRYIGQDDIGHHRWDIGLRIVRDVVVRQLNT